MPKKKKRVRGDKPLDEQVRDRVNNPPEGDWEPRWNRVISTGSTLLDLAISSGRAEYGGLPGGLLVEIYGPSGTGKTALLSEIAGNVQRAGGEARFDDPEARLDKEHARIYGVEISKDNYNQPDTIPEVFEAVRKWKIDSEIINVSCADSLAALSTDLEMGEKGDKYGMRRAKLFSQETRKTCRVMQQKNILMICSNQIRDNVEGYGEKQIAPGGHAMEFYASLRMKLSHPFKIIKEITIVKPPKKRTSKLAIQAEIDVDGKKEKKIKRVIGIQTNATIVKSSIDIPWRIAPIHIIFNYGIDDIRGNLQWLKDMTGETTYRPKSFKAIETAIRQIEINNLEDEIKEQVKVLWLEIEEKSRTKRKPKR